MFEVDNRVRESRNVWYGVAPDRMTAWRVYTYSIWGIPLEQRSDLELARVELEGQESEVWHLASDENSLECRW